MLESKIHPLSILNQPLPLRTFTLNLNCWLEPCWILSRGVGADTDGTRWRTSGPLSHQLYIMIPCSLARLPSAKDDLLVLSAIPPYVSNPDANENIAKGTTDPRVKFHITRSQFTNLEHITISESRLSINFKISTKHQYLD